MALRSDHLCTECHLSAQFEDADGDKDMEYVASDEETNSRAEVFEADGKPPACESCRFIECK